MRLGALLMASAAKSLVVLPRAEWAARAAAHRTRVADLLGGRPGDVAKTCAADPFLNFVFTYYKGDLGKPARLERLTAPAHVALEAGGDAEDGKLLWRPGQQKGDSMSLQRDCSARAFQKQHPRFESAPRDDRSSKNQPKRAENDRDRSL